MLRHFIPRNDNRVFAFTLAEVLITLVIIGVIAALTIPNLMKNYQNHMYVVALKRSMHNLQTYVDRLKIDTDCVGEDMSCTLANIENTTGQFNLKYSPLAYSKKLYKGYIKTYDPWTRGMPETAKYLNGATRAYYWLMINGVENNKMFLMPDGTLYNAIGDCRWNRLQVYLDTNGIKGPNQWGRDIFWIAIAEDSGKVVPDYNTGCKNMTTPSYDSGKCAAYWIATHGWKMDY